MSLRAMAMITPARISRTAKAFAPIFVGPNKFLKTLLVHACAATAQRRSPSARQILWAFEVLADEGYAYSSSIYPIRHDLYGMPGAPRFAFRPLANSQFVEVPISTLRWASRNFPCGGGGYFRLLPYACSKWSIGRLNRFEGQASIFYLHPWELDPDQPRPRHIAVKTRLRHYLNLDRMERRLSRLLADFRWGRMDDLFVDSSIATSRIMPYQIKRLSEETRAAWDHYVEQAPNGHVLSSLGMAARPARNLRALSPLSLRRTRRRNLRRPTPLLYQEPPVRKPADLITVRRRRITDQ